MIVPEYIPYRTVVTILDHEYDIDHSIMTQPTENPRTHEGVEFHVTNHLTKYR
jgi:hypothetical protein